MVDLAAAVALVVLRVAAPAAYQGAAARVWATQKAARDFFNQTLSEAGNPLGPWPHRPPEVTSP